MPQGFHHFCHLVVRAFVCSYVFLGTSPGGIAAQIISIIGIEVKGGWWRMAAWKQNWQGGLKRAFVTLAVVWSVVFAACVMTTVYDDHEALVKANDKLRKEKTGAVSQYAFAPDSEYASVSNTMYAFSILVNPPEAPSAKSVCQLKVTFPSENTSVGDMLFAMAREVGCNVSFTASNPDLHPDEAEEAEHGAVPNYVIVHASKDNPKAEAFTTMLSNVFSVKRSFELPDKSPPNLVWLQLGTGNLWRKN